MNDLVICEECRSQGKKSIVYNRGGFRNLLGWESYYDEEGVHHSHDPNILKVSFECSNGHWWIKKIHNTCACGWTTE